MTAYAHVNWGRWVATCPNPQCNNAEELHPWPNYQCGHSICRVTDYPDTIFHCTDCRTIDAIKWPIDAQEIWAALRERPRLETRNWYPSDHEQALQWNLPNGQSADDLRKEQRIKEAS